MDGCVHNQPCLPNFPTTTLATAQRKKQATLRKIKNEAVKDSLTGYSRLFGDVLPAEFMQEVDNTQRKRHYGFTAVFWTWFSQLLSGNVSCTFAVSLLQGWYRAIGAQVPSKDSSAYCRARKKVTTDQLTQIYQQVTNHLERNTSTQDLWKGHNLLAIDGTTFKLMDTAQNQESYPQPSGQKEGCGFPVMGAVAMVNLSHGGVTQVEVCGYQKHDAKVAPSLLPAIEKGDIVLGDRAFCSYEFIARITKERQGHVVMRLSQIRHMKLDWRKGKKLSKYERLVTWKRPKSKPQGSNLSKEEWEALPEQLTLRYVKLGYENRNGDKSMMVVVTDLLDPEIYPGHEIIDLYAQRWEIEVKFRDIKTTLGMEKMAVKTPEMARATLQMSIIVYNLLRVKMQQAAALAGKKVNAMSVQGIRAVLLASHEAIRPLMSKPKLLAQRITSVLQTCATHLLDIRLYRHEPRAIKTRMKSYQLLTKHRSIFQEIPHRSRYRKPA